MPVQSLPSSYWMMDPHYRPGTPSSHTAPADLMIGDVVYINGEGDWRGKICYLGEVHFQKGDWAGVALDHPMGHHDGTTHHRRYFQCPPNHGIFTRLHRLSKKMLIPETFNGEKLGLKREIFHREYSASPPPSVVTSRESSPFASRQVSVGFDEVRRSPTPTSAGGHHGIRIGDRVIVASSVGESKPGILRYVGGVDFAEGEFTCCVYPCSLDLYPHLSVGVVHGYKSTRRKSGCLTRESMDRVFGVGSKG